MKSFLKVGLGIAIIYISPLVISAQADLAEDFKDQLTAIWNDSALTPYAKAKQLDLFTGAHAGTDAEVTANLIANAIRIQDDDVKVSNVESALARYKTLQNWHGVFARVSLIFLWHTDGKHSSVVSAGEEFLHGADADVFDNNADAFLNAVKAVFPLSKASVRKAIASAVVQGYQMLGNSTRAAELRSSYGI